MKKFDKDCQEALERIVKNETRVIPKNSRISKDNVALEAGKCKGAIRSKDENRRELIRNIEAAAQKQKKNSPVNKTKEKIAKTEMLLNEALNRELMLLKQLRKLKSDKG